MVSKKLTLSIVIPVFNEEDHLADCLDSIAAQGEAPDEVIVVDNNSIDASVEVAKRYPFVKLLHEPNQHQAFAQKTGFDQAKGEILGRIDADTVLPENWTQRVKQYFASEPGLKAITGTPLPYDVYSERASRAVFSFYHALASHIAGQQMIWGANAAFRASEWRKIRTRVLQRADIWEDYDLSLLMEEKNAVKLVKDIEVGASFRAIHKPFLAQAEWQFRVIRTFYYRRPLYLTLLLALCWSTLAILYPLTVLDHKVFKPAFDFKERRREVLEPTALVD
jgi:glycosyltransferase involved in cell wall biosynthesis